MLRFRILTQVQYQGTVSKSMVTRTVSKKAFSFGNEDILSSKPPFSLILKHPKYDTTAIILSINDDGVKFAIVTIFGYFQGQTLPIG